MWQRYLVLLTLVGWTALAGTVGAAEAPEDGAARGELRSLAAWPEKVELVGADDRAQLLLTGSYPGGAERDVTRQVALRSLDAKVVQVTSAGQLIPQANGATQIVAELAGRSASIPVAVQGMDRDQPINFANEINPILTKLGCNAGACHGKADGQNGFRLSLLGFDSLFDYGALVREGRGRRVIPAAPDRSLLLLKPSGGLGHGGGKLMPADSAEYALLHRWIRSGAPRGSDADPVVVGISVMPELRSLPRRSQQQLAVIAHYSDGTQRDVTARTEFRANDAEIVDVTTSGLVETLDQFGQGSVMLRYLGHVTVFRALIPLSEGKVAASFPAANNYIDQHVYARLGQLGITPSELCTDGEFLRRASLDITGTLPTLAEAERFLADNDPNKRARLIDELLQRPAYASYFTLKWADILRLRGGSREGSFEGKRGKDGLDTPTIRGNAYYEWIHQSIVDNKPYDQFVRELLTTQGSTSGPETKPTMAWYLELKSVQGLVDDTAQAFLGTRIQCAQCHHHPFEKWSQDDYWGLAGYFGRVQWQAKGKDGAMTAVRLSEGARIGQFIGLDSQGTVINPAGKVYPHPQPLDGAEEKIPADQDPRDKLVDWMARPDNPFFAPALVNRYWAHFFSRGIVEPIDDMRVTNPPTNPELMAALAKDFIDHKFDLKHVIRTICNSRTYQLSSAPNESNQFDKQNFARYLPVRLGAEVLLDAIDQVTGKQTEFTANGGFKFPLGTRAIELPDHFISSYFLDTFGRPDRMSACACERESSITLAQRVHLLNGSAVRTGLNFRANQLAADPRPVEEKIRDVYLAAFTRPPDADELGAIQTYLASAGQDDRQKLDAYLKVMWAIVNTKEFSFNH